MNTPLTVEVPPTLDLYIMTNEEGEAQATVEVSWTLSDELIEHIQSRGFKNPHILLAVTRRVTRGIGNRTIDSFVTTKAYAIDLLRKPQKEYVQFSSIGENVLIGAVVDMANRDEIESVNKLLTGLPELRIKAQPTADGQDSSYEWLFRGLSILGVKMKSVMVPKEFFAKTPPAWQRTLVKKFFPGKEFDECHFRKRRGVAIAATIPIQLYGLIVRPVLLLVGLFMGMRGMTLRSFFAYNPHDFAREWSNSIWFVDKDGWEYSEIRQILSPPGIVLSALVLGFAAALLSLLPLAYISLAGSITEANGGEYSYWAWQNIIFAFLVTDVPIAAIIAILTLWDKGFIGDWSRSIKSFLTGRNVVKEPVPAEAFAALRERQALAIQPAEVKDTTFHLRYHAVKRAVCKPFAQN